MNEIIWKILFVIVFFGMAAIRIPYNRMHKASKIKSSERPGIERALVILNFSTMGLIPLIAVFSPWLDIFRFHIPDWFRAVGLAVFAASLSLFFWTHKSLGSNWSPILEIKSDHRLIREGPYKYVRHPMYTQIWIWVFCQGIVLSNWFVGVAGVVAWAILFFIRVPREERMLADEFGDQFTDFKRATGCVFPKLIQPQKSQCRVIIM